MAQPGLSSPEHEDRLDLEALQSRPASSSSSSPSLSSSSGATSGLDSEASSDSAHIWPLKLRTQLVKHYILGDSVGKGAYAEVRECIDTRDLQRRAVKVVSRDFLARQSPAALANQEREIRLLRRLRHQNVIALLDYFRESSKMYIVLEFGTFVLHDLLADPQPALSRNLIRCLFSQLISGVHYLHSVGVVHRDLKAQNVLLSACGTLKIVDFGVACELSMWDCEGVCEANEGSPLYQAPEIVACQRSYVATKVDIWSAGVLLYLMLYGQHPFEDESLLNLYDKILAEPLRIPTPAGDTPDELSEGPSRAVEADLLHRMLDKDHRRRLTSDQVLEHRWLTFQGAHSRHHEHGEFMRITQLQTTRAPADQRGPAKDFYRSMTVLPYLYNHHFPGQLASLPTRPASPAEPGPHEILDEGSQGPAWGTERQYQLLKVPQIRSNRVRQLRRRGPKRKRDP